MTRVLIDPFQAAYMQRALLELLVLSLMMGPVSVFVLLRRRAFMADALTHTVFPGVAIAFAAGSSLVVGAGLAAALSIALLGLGTVVRRVDADSMLVVLIGGFFSVGVVVVSRSTSFTADLNQLLFGKVLAVDRAEITTTALIGAVVLVVLAMLAKEFVALAFDELAATAWGLPVHRLDLILNALIALVIVASLKAVGTLLVVAMVVVPGAIARACSQRIAVMIGIAVAVLAGCSWIGLGISYEASVHHDVRLASGATVVLLLVAAFGVAMVGRIAMRFQRPVKKDAACTT